VPLLLALVPSAHPDGRLALHFLDVGQGDGAVIRTPGGQ
jgi:beta-lactamase superfamily II metal-dependent hydrolase